MLAGLITFLKGTVLPALGIGALSGLASTDVQKLIANGLYLNNNNNASVFILRRLHQDDNERVITSL